MRARVAFALGVVATLAACTSSDDGGTGKHDDHPWSDDVTLVSALSSFGACDDMLEYVTEHALRTVGPWGLDGGWPIEVGEFAREEAAAGDDADGVADAAGAAPSLTEGVDYSGTNVQEAGVDEPDRVKTDGQLLYLVRNDELVIVDVSNEQPTLLSTTQLHSWGANLLRSGDRLLVFGETDGRMDRGGLTTDDMGWFHGTRLALYDVSNPAAPTQVAVLDVDGWVISARLVDGAARVVVNATNTPQFEMPGNRGIRSERDATERNREIIRNSAAEDWLPYYVHTAGSSTDEGILLPCEQVNHPAQFSGLGTTSVLTFDLDGDLSPGAATGVLASGNTIYASPERLYVATNRWVDWGALSDAAIREVNRDYSTDLHAFDISGADRATYLGSGTVRGHVLNQWAMSAHDGVLRVATTEGAARWTWGEDEALSESFVTTLAERDGALVQLGQVGGLGLDERIYAVRFMGDIGYVVTFRETDPLYTVDLSDPAEPTVLGELKIMGYSAYLHPIGDDLLLGVGQDADERGRVEGLQLSLFDVADLADPQRIHQVTIEEAYSSAEWDHHAFLHWPVTGITVVPYEQWRWDEESETEEVDSGALAYTLDRESGFTDLGRLTHMPADVDETHPRFWDIAWRTSIQRSIVIGDTLYTVSDLGVKSSDLETLADRGWLGLPAR